MNEEYLSKDSLAREHKRNKERAADWYNSKHKAIRGGEYIIEE